MNWQKLFQTSIPRNFKDWQKFFGQQNIWSISDQFHVVPTKFWLYQKKFCYFIKISVGTTTFLFSHLILVELTKVLLFN